MNAPQVSIKLFIICSGLGRIRRGYESFAEECSKALKYEQGLEVRLFGSTGAATHGAAVELASLARDNRRARQLGSLLWRDGYFIEQATFAYSLVPHLIRDKPDIILCSDRSTLDFLWLVRRLLGLRYRLLASNGGPIGPPFTRTDFVQHVVEETYNKSREIGEPMERHFLVPYGFDFQSDLQQTSGDGTVSRHRRALKLPEDRHLVVAVGAINCYQKRVDYVVREVAASAGGLSHRRPFLLLLGQSDAETPRVCELATSLLGPTGFDIRTVPPSVMPAYYAVADTFTLGSLSEGFGRVIVEACGAGLPCLLHDSPNSRYIVGDFGYYADFRSPGALANLLNQLLISGASPDELRRQRRRWAFDRFSWYRLVPQYLEMLRKCMDIPLLS
jgi:1,2-diacylglycerol 3-alpha-glucosyltransferase